MKGYPQISSELMRSKFSNAFVNPSLEITDQDTQVRYIALQEHINKTRRFNRNRSEKLLQQQMKREEKTERIKEKLDFKKKAMEEIQKKDQEF